MARPRPACPACPTCGKPVIWARTEAMKHQALNPDPDPAGCVHAYETGPGNWLARSCKPGTLAVYPDRVYIPHQATCTGPRAPEKPAPGLVFLDAWRTERAQHAKAGRQRRGRQAAAQITGIRVNPGR